MGKKHPTFSCPDCGKDFSDNTKLRQHQGGAHIRKVVSGDQHPRFRPEATHGTRIQYLRELRAGVETCAECRAANATAAQLQRKGKGS